MWLTWKWNRISTTTSIFYYFERTKRTCIVSSVLWVLLNIKRKHVILYPSIKRTDGVRGFVCNKLCSGLVFSLKVPLWIAKIREVILFVNCCHLVRDIYQWNVYNGLYNNLLQNINLQARQKQLFNILKIFSIKFSQGNNKAGKIYHSSLTSFALLLSSEYIINILLAGAHEQETTQHGRFYVCQCDKLYDMKRYFIHKLEEHCIIYLILSSFTLPPLFHW